ncbi:MAG TPA: radical SAM protein [Deltaproteobacteria bacterium]|nr:radical SAM protein [Deltaproteobacteria bacterium]HPR56047.1 radical SAM protein [Deltaproteobacteria bacterium]HXK47843.1 radical SAM protein [Deltaproteobacteria bacterium]
MIHDPSIGKKPRQIFGPVPSRRLGRSLGVDLVPFKTCTYNCIYCQLGRTTNLTVDRREWFPLDEIIEELKGKLVSSPDWITLSGSGEPTLYSRLGELIARIRTITDIPVAVLTNGALLWQEEVRRELMDAHLVIPSLDAGDQAMFTAVNRPHQSIAFDLMVDGLSAFRSSYHGQYWLEVFILGGHTAMKIEVEKIAACAARAEPDRIQLNTVTRPPAEDIAVGVDLIGMEKLTTLFTPRAEVIADFRGVHDSPEFSATSDTVLDLLRRRPCTIDDIAGGLGIHLNEAVKYVEDLLGKGLVGQVELKRKTCYRARPGG